MKFTTFVISLNNKSETIIIPNKIIINLDSYLDVLHAFAKLQQSKVWLK